MYPGAAGNIGGIDNMLYRPEIHGTPAENMQPIGVARGESPYKEEKEYDKGWPPKPIPKDDKGLSFQNMLGSSNLQGAVMNDPTSFQTAQVGSTDAERRQVLQEIINTPGYDPASVREAQRQWLRLEQGLQPFPKGV